MFERTWHPKHNFGAFRAYLICFGDYLAFKNDFNVFDPNYHPKVILSFFESYLSSKMWFNWLPTSNWLQVAAFCYQTLSSYKKWDWLFFGFIYFRKILFFVQWYYLPCFMIMFLFQKFISLSFELILFPKSWIHTFLIACELIYYSEIVQNWLNFNNL